MSLKTKISLLELDVPLHTFQKRPIRTTKYCDVYPASETLFSSLLSKSVLDKWLNAIKIKDININIDERLRPYQKEGIKYLIQRQCFGVFDQQRLGKTPMVLSALNHLDIERVIIIVPKSLIQNWVEECKNWYTEDCLGIKGSKETRKKLYSKLSKVIVLSYQTVLQDFDILEKYNFNCMIIDEAHRLRNFKGQRSKQSPKSVKQILKLSYKIKYKFALTGTPAPNKSENIYPILHFLYPDTFNSYYAFIDYYYTTQEKYINRYDTIMEVTGFQLGKQEELQDLLNNISIQRKRVDYMKWIPLVDRKEIVLSLDKKEQKWYNELANTFECAELNISCPNNLSLLTTQRKILAKASNKINYIKEYIEDYPDESIIIASEFTSVLKELKELIPSAELVIGDTPINRRFELQQSFNNKTIKILLCNIQVIKEGMKLEACNTMIILDPSLTYTDNEQLEDRLLPTSKEVAINKDKQQIIYLLIEKSVDIFIKKQLKEKASKVEIINNYNKFIKNRLN